MTNAAPHTSGDNRRPASIELSIVTTLYRSAPFVREFYERVSRVAEQVARSWELIFVNDGSPDHAAALAEEIAARDERVTLVDLSRNFGHHPAVMAGLEQSRGEGVFLIDVDLEEQPEWLTTFDRALRETGADVVFGVQTQRADRWTARVFSVLFYRLFNTFSETKIPENLCTVRLMKRVYVDSLLQMRDRCLFLGGNLQWAGFQQHAIPVDKKIRESGSSYTLARKLSLSVNAITSFSAYPLKLIFLIGLLITLISGLFGIAMIVQKLIWPDRLLAGWSSLIVSIWFLGGMIIAFLGVIGLYLSKIFVEVKDRPTYIVRRIVRGKGAASSEPAHRSAPEPARTDA